MRSPFAPGDQVFFLVLATLSLTATRAAHDNSNSCSCYKTDSSLYFQYHRFFDFGSLASSGGVYYRSEPNNVTNALSTGAEPAQPGYLSSTTFMKDWTIKTWGHDASPTRPVKLQNSRQNVWLRYNNGPENSTCLALRTYRNSNQSSSAEITTNQTDLLYASIRTFARIRGDPGAVAGIFTFFNDSQESDIEILTRDEPQLVHYTNQPATDSRGHTVAAAESQVTIPNDGVWSDWNTYRLDWLPAISQWYINGIPSANKTYGVPATASSLILNVWSNGGNWSGNMTVGSAAYLEVRWIEIFYNTSQSDEVSGTCRTVCAADNVRQIGYPEILHTSGVTRLLSVRILNCLSAVFGVAIVLAF